MYGVWVYKSWSWCVVRLWGGVVCVGFVVGCGGWAGGGVVCVGGCWGLVGLGVVGV